MRALIIAVVAVSTMLGSALTAGAATSGPTFKRYVALGDSYTSGPLIPAQRLDPVGCFRSTNNYPALLARKLKTRSYTDVSCGGADTTNMTSPQDIPLSLFGPLGVLGPNPPQFDALRADTDLVTLGIGGNDYSVFGRVISTCPGLRDSDPTGNPCQRYFTVDGVDTLKAAVVNTEANITAVLKGIHQRSPRATVLAIGYPRIAPPSGTCPAVLPFADGDYAWLNSVEEALNAAVTGAVAADGSSSYVDTYPPSLGHDACADEPWINGKDTNLLAAVSYHPFYAGMAGVAAATYAHLTSSVTARRPAS